MCFSSPTTNKSGALHLQSGTAPRGKSRAPISIRVRLSPWASGRSRGTASRRQIIDLGRSHLVTDGAAGLSLRAIARELGMVSSAVYRYVGQPRRTADTAAGRRLHRTRRSVERARDAAARADGGTSLPAWRAPRGQWAVEKPAGWALLYGSPVPGYHAPAATRPSARAPAWSAHCSTVVAAGVAAGDIAAFETSGATSTFIGLRPAASRVQLRRRRRRGGKVPRAVGVAGRRDQPRGVRPVRPDTFTEPALVFDTQVRLLVDMLGQKPH